MTGFRHNGAMSTRYLRSQDSGMGWTARIFLAILVLLILGAVGLGIYASTLSPPHHTYREVLPDSRFPS